MPETPQPGRAAGIDTFECGSTGAPLLLVTGPPVGARLFRHIQARLAPRRSVAVELLSSPQLFGVDALLERLQAVVDELEPELVFAHGLSVPLALQLQTAHVVASNGPVTAVDLIVSGLSRLGETVLARTVLRPGFATRWLGSSGGLRRTVANPYVMDHDIVVMLTEAVLHSRESRRSAASWMAGVGTMVPATNPKPELISAIWGDHDPLYPLAEAESLVPSERLLVIPGGRYFHPEERPWETADRLLALTTT